MNILAVAFDSNAYYLQLLVHIASVAVWFGSAISVAVAASSAGKQEGTVLAWFAGLSKVLNMRVKSVAFVLLFISGMGLVGMSEKFFAVSDPFVSMGFATIIIGGALGGMVHAPASKAIAAAAESNDLAAAKAATKKMSLVNGVEIVLVLITMFMMISARG